MEWQRRRFVGSDVARRFGLTRQEGAVCRRVEHSRRVGSLQCSVACLANNESVDPERFRHTRGLGPRVLQAVDLEALGSEGRHVSCRTVRVAELEVRAPAREVQLLQDGLSRTASAGSTRLADLGSVDPAHDRW